jgi:dienelactone hydrolase
MSSHASATPIPVESLATILSIAPLTLPADDRGADLELRVTAPVTSDPLPVLIFSHGNGQSLYAYGPLANYWAANGFAVIQPTHLDSRMLALAANDARRPQLWRHRENDLVRILNDLDAIEDMARAIGVRFDRDRIAVAGHSWGAQTASMLLGATHPDPDDGSVVNITDPRVKAGVLLAVPGSGGDNLSPFAAQNFPFMHPDFSGMQAPTLIVAGDHDNGAMTVRGPEWWREAYDLSPAPKSLLTVFGGEHSLGGIPNYEARETTDESPLRLAAVQEITTRFLQGTLYPGDKAAWETATASLQAGNPPQGNVETK